MDDTFLLIPSKTDFSSLMSPVNSIDHCIQFIFEVESDKSLSFLNVLVSKHIDGFSTMVFRKSFWISLPLHALCNHAPQQKIFAFYTYVYRALHICSDPSNLSNEFNYLKSLALSRGHNPFIINKALKKIKKPKSSICHSVCPCFNPFVLLFYSFIFFFFKIFKIFSRFGFKVSFKPVNKIKLSSPKDPIPTTKWFLFYSLIFL